MEFYWHGFSPYYIKFWFSFSTVYAKITIAQLFGGCQGNMGKAAWRGVGAGRIKTIKTVRKDSQEGCCCRGIYGKTLEPEYFSMLY
jgi:hypothetical protein